MQWRISPVARLAAGVAAAAMALAAVPLTASAEVPATDWTTVGGTPAGATIQTVAGTSDGAGGCAFDFSPSLAPSQTVQRADEVAFSASTCQSRVAFTSNALAAPAPADPSGASVMDSGSVASTQTATAAAAAVVPLAATHSAGYVKSWYQDPPGIVVNSVQNSTDWHWNRRCVVAPVSAGFQYHWYTPSGWFLLQNNWQNNYTCAQSTSSSYAHFINDIFCMLHPTDVTYDRNNVHGQANGTLSGSVHASKIGICSPLLSFHWVLRRTLN
jgi:hypothetical protein